MSGNKYSKPMMQGDFPCGCIERTKEVVSEFSPYLLNSESAFLALCCRGSDLPVAQGARVDGSADNPGPGIDVFTHGAAVVTVPLPLKAGTGGAKFFEVIRSLLFPAF